MRLWFGGEKSFGATEAVLMRNVAVNVMEAVVPGAGHWLMEENPTFTDTLAGLRIGRRSPRSLLRSFCPGQIEATGDYRVSPTESRLFSQKEGENLACHEEARNNRPGPTHGSGPVADDTRHSFSVEAVGVGCGWRRCTSAAARTAALAVRRGDRDVELVRKRILRQARAIHGFFGRAELAGGIEPNPERDVLYSIVTRQSRESPLDRSTNARPQSQLWHPDDSANSGTGSHF